MSDASPNSRTPASITLWKDHVEYHVEYDVRASLKEGAGGWIPYSSHEGDRTRSLALGEALEEILRYDPAPLVRVIQGK